MKNTKRRFVLFLTFLLMAEGTAFSGELFSGARLRVTSGEEPSLNTVIEIGWDGEADIPLCGRVRLKGIDVTSAGEVLSGCLTRFYKKLPRLQIEEVLPRQMAVKVGYRGELMRVVKVAHQTSVNTLLASEGFAAKSEFGIRLLSPFGLDIVAIANAPVWNQPFKWRGGETVILEKGEPAKSSEYFDVLGEVRKPGKIPYKPNLKVMDVLREAQGPTSQASYNEVRIYRLTSGRSIETHWDDFQTRLAPGDVFYVPAQKESWGDRGMRWAGSLLAMINTVFLIVLSGR